MVPSRLFLLMIIVSLGIGLIALDSNASPQSVGDFKKSVKEERSFDSAGRLCDFRLLATNKTSTMQKEMNEAAEAGLRFEAVMGGETAFGGSEVVVVMSKDLGSQEGGRYDYRLLATSKTSTRSRPSSPITASRCRSGVVTRSRSRHRRRPGRGSTASSRRSCSRPSCSSSNRCSPVRRAAWSSRSRRSGDEVSSRRCWCRAASSVSGTRSSWGRPTARSARSSTNGTAPCRRPARHNRSRYRA